MIIKNENLNQINLSIHKTLKYSEEYSFIPIRIINEGKNSDIVLETPSLFIPYGIQNISDNKKIIDVSFQNKENDKKVFNFEKKLILIYKIINKKYKNILVNDFIKYTDYDNCMRLKINKFTKFYDQFKNLTIPKAFSYGKFIIHLEGLWLNNNNIWFQWNVLQGKLYQEIKILEYSFDENNNCEVEDKYEKMLKMGVPKEAVSLKKNLDKGIPPPPPPPLHSPFPNKKNTSISKIKAEDLQNVVLKRTIIKKQEPVKRNNLFEPPSLEELKITISKLKKSKLVI